MNSNSRSTGSPMPMRPRSTSKRSKSQIGSRLTSMKNCRRCCQTKRPFRVSLQRRRIPLFTNVWTASVKKRCFLAMINGSAPSAVRMCPHSKRCRSRGCPSTSLSTLRGSRLIAAISAAPTQALRAAKSKNRSTFQQKTLTSADSARNWPTKSCINRSKAKATPGP